MSIGDVQQVTQPAAPVVSAFVADAVFQDHKVSAEGPQECVHFLWGPLRIYLINLQNEIKYEPCAQPSSAWGSLGVVMLRPDAHLPLPPGPLSTSLELGICTEK